MNRRMLSELSGGHPKDRRRVWYALRGESLDPTEITALVDIAPDRSWQAGDLMPRTGKPYREGAWMIDSGLEDDGEFHDQLDALLARMRPAWASFVDLGRRFEASVGAAIDLAEAQGPLVFVLPDISAAVAELNATIGFDLYAAGGLEMKVE